MYQLTSWYDQYPIYLQGVILGCDKPSPRIHAYKSTFGFGQGKSMWPLNMFHVFPGGATVTLASWVRPPGDPTVCKAFQTSFREGQFFLGQNHLNSHMVVNLGWNFQKIWLLPPNKKQTSPQNSTLWQSHIAVDDQSFFLSYMFIHGCPFSSQLSFKLSVEVFFPILSLETEVFRDSPLWCDFVVDYEPTKLEPVISD